MSFLKTLATLAVGFAAAKGVQKYREGGGMTGLQGNLRNAGAAGGLADSIGSMAEKMGIPGGTEAVRKMFSQVGGAMAGGTEAAQTGLGGLMGAMTGAAATGSGALGDMISSLTGGTPAGAMLENNAKLMIRAMIEAAKADGVIDADEQAKIIETLGDASPDEVAYVEGLLAAPLDMAGLVAATDASMRAQVYSTSLMAIRLDSAAEHDYLDRLASALEIDDATRAGLDAQMGAA